MMLGFTLGRCAPALSTIGLIGLLAAPAARADQFHYNNLTIGTRAVGMGGAFTAVADDASGVYYNPAGLAFALSNDISGSANAYYQKKATYKNTLCGDDFVEESGGSVPSFFGGLQKLDRYVEGLVFAFGAYSTDSDLKDQDTLMKNKSEGCNGVTIERYHRSSNARANSYYAGAAVGKRIGTSVAWGVGVSYVNMDELVQEYQDVRQTTALNETTQGWKLLASNVRQRLTVFGAQPVLGIQAALPANVAIGLTLKKGIVASQSLQVDSETQTNIMTNDQKAALDANGSALGATGKVNSRTVAQKPIGSLPAEVRLGIAWFASPVLLWTVDIAYHTAVTDAAVIKDEKDISIFGERPYYAKEAVVDLATGVEYYVMPAIPLRFGLFTNNDARPKVAKGDYQKGTDKTCSNADWRKKYCGQPDHIDYLGETLFIAWVQPNSQVAAGFVLQQGKGQAQKLGDYHVQDVVASSYTFAFSATHNL